MGKRTDLTGQKFNRLLVIKPSNRSPRHWDCLCDCGNITSVRTDQLTRIYSKVTSETKGLIKSCGCMQKEMQKTAHLRNFNNRYYEGTDLVNIGSSISKNNTSGTKGVSYSKDRHMWRAYIGFKGKIKYLGHYPTKEEAIEAREKAEEEFFKPMLEKYGKLEGE